MSFIQSTKLKDQLNSSTLIYIGEVRSIDDDTDALRIKCRIKGIDDGVNDAELPWSLPFLPKFLNIVPKVGEAVKIIIFDLANQRKDREWIGPIISQPQNLSYESYLFSSRTGKNYSTMNPDIAPSTLPDVTGGFPDKEEIAIQGRENTDIIQRKKEVLIRAGKFDPEEIVKPYNKKIKLNIKNPSYVSLKLADNGTSWVNLVADRINLISHGGSPTMPVIFDVNSDQDKLDKLHPLPYGDVLLDFLKLVKTFCLTHVQSGPKLPPNIGSGDLLKIRDFDLDSILGNQKIRIN